jgi:hypothetical protein
MIRRELQVIAVHAHLVVAVLHAKCSAQTVINSPPTVIPFAGVYYLPVGGTLNV